MRDNLSSAKMDAKQVLIDLKINTVEEKNTRCDPISLLPEEPMVYPIKKKKKKKKKKEKQEDPFKDIAEKALVTERIMMADEEVETEAETNPEPVAETNPEPEAETNPEPEAETNLDPEVTVKAEKIEEDVHYDDFADNTDLMDDAPENIDEPEVKIEPENHVVDVSIKYELTFEDIVRDREAMAVDGVLENFDATKGLGEQAVSYRCQVCHLLFKTPKTLAMHQNRKHKIFRRNNKHTCDDCGMSYQFKGSLIAHIKRKHGPNASPDDHENRTCDICYMVFKGMNRLRMHMRRKHNCYEESFDHVCPKCGLTYDKYGSLLVHLRRKHQKSKKPAPNQLFKCQFCPKIYNTRETHARHMERNHKVNEDGMFENRDEYWESCRNEAGEIACKECALVFTTVSFLKLHMRRKHNAFKEDFKIKCKICNLSYAKIDSLKNHIQRKHGTKTDCNICGKEFENPAAYLSHSHVRPVKECPLCGRPFATQGGLSKHIRCTHKAESPKVVFCNICNEGFHSKRLLKPHMMRVHYNVSYKCGTCRKVFKSKETYRRHITTIHPVKSLASNELQKCEQCPQSFSDEFELCQHINLVHLDPSSEFAKQALVIKQEDNSEPFHCTKCPDTFGTWEQVRVHFEQTHCTENTVQCQACGEMIPETKLHKHMRVSHTVMKEVKCKYCDFKSNIRTSMTQHTLRHKNATTINCDYPNCRYKSYYEGAMTKHKQRHEEQGEKFQCSKCAFQSMNKYLLKYHEEAHETGKKKYACNQCDYSTVLPANLVQHKYKHSTEKRFKCEVCPFASKFNTSLRFHVKTKHCDLPTLSK